MSERTEHAPRDPFTSSASSPPSSDDTHGPIVTLGRAIPRLTSRPVAAAPPFDAARRRADFPILSEQIHGRPLVWLDNAATTQKPQAVLDRLLHYYVHENSNVHRAAHTLAARATDAYEAARETVRSFVNAPSSREIVFVRGATEGINLVAQSWGRRHVHAGDEVVISGLEHHSNIVPWQVLCAETGARLRIIPVDDRGDLRLDAYEDILGPATKIVALTHVSNALGTVTPVAEMIRMAHQHDARVLIDGAQAVSHLPVDVQTLDCDFYALSGHKVYGPTGIGALYGKADALDAAPPWQGGGNMIMSVAFDRTHYQPAPARFEAGTGNIAGAVGLAAAIEYLMSAGIDAVKRHEEDLLEYASTRLSALDRVRLVGQARRRAGVVSFLIDGIAPTHVGAALDRCGIAVRTGHHCAQPALAHFGLQQTIRASFGLYNTRADVDALIEAVADARPAG